MMKAIKQFICRKLGHDDVIKSFIHDDQGFCGAYLLCRRCHRVERQDRDFVKGRIPAGWLK